MQEGTAVKPGDWNRVTTIRLVNLGCHAAEKSHLLSDDFTLWRLTLTTDDYFQGLVNNALSSYMGSS